MIIERVLAIAVHDNLVQAALVLNFIALTCHMSAQRPLDNVQIFPEYVLLKSMYTASRYKTLLQNSAALILTSSLSPMI